MFLLQNIENAGWSTSQEIRLFFSFAMPVLICWLFSLALPRQRWTGFLYDDGATNVTGYCSRAGSGGTVSQMIITNPDVERPISVEMNFFQNVSSSIGNFPRLLLSFFCSCFCYYYYLFLFLLLFICCCLLLMSTLCTCSAWEAKHFDCMLFDCGRATAVVYCAWDSLWVFALLWRNAVV